MTENGIMVSSPSADDLTSNGDNGHKIITKTAKMPDRLAPPDVCHRHHQHKKRFEFPNTYICTSDESEPSWLEPGLELNNFQLGSAWLVTFTFSWEVSLLRLEN